MEVVRSIATEKGKNGKSRTDVYVPMLCAKPYWRYIPHVKSKHKTYHTRLCHHMAKQIIWRVRINKIKFQCIHLYPTRLIMNSRLKTKKLNKTLKPRIIIGRKKTYRRLSRACFLQNNKIK